MDQETKVSQEAEPPTYDVREVERRWNRRWKEDPPLWFDALKVRGDRKFYNLVEFPYPSAEGLHVGHVYTYTGADTLGRYLRLKGWDVFQPMGFDSFGIHTENYALKTGEHPRQLTERTIANYRRQLEQIGCAWDWDYAVTTSDPSYYRWTQWIFVQLFKAGLAVRKESPVVWCPSCLTVLAFEQLEGDRCERCHTVVTTKVMNQWYLRITAYADSLLDALEELDWPEMSKRLQREWIGRSHGTEIVFSLDGDPGKDIRTFTTRADTLMGVTFLVLSPEHPLVEQLAAESKNEREIREYVEAARRRAGIERYWASDEGGARGVATDKYAIHPLTGEPVPIFIADYVLLEYGTGAVMGVPAHDARDFDFAREFDVPIRRVVTPTDGSHPAADEAFTDDGVLTASGSFDDFTSAEARQAITRSLEERGLGRGQTRYRLHDWLVSRQRYWGSPIPVIYCPECGTVPVPEEDLPVELPPAEEVQPTGTGKSPLATVEDFVHTACPRCGEPATRETDVLDTFVESAWYFLRYPSVHRDDVPWDPEVTRRVLPVDMYAGGREHTTRHHLYARFVTRALHDLGHLPFAEPFKRLRLHGLLVKGHAKMSKSRGNVVNPDEYIDWVGADALRAYLLFCGPWEEGGDFSDRALQGVVRFNFRLWRLVTEPFQPGPGGVDMRHLDRTVHKVETEIQRLKFNTAIAELMKLTQWMRDSREQMSDYEWDRACETLVLLLAPFEPFLAEELWWRLDKSYSVHGKQWPGYDPGALQEDTVEVAVQVNGKVRGQLEGPRGLEEQDAVTRALEDPAVRNAVGDQEVRRVVFVPDRVLNLVV